MILANENSIYIYYEAIKQLEPKRILDVGMFLKRIGNVSRCAMECEVPAEIRLVGVDFFPEVSMPVWEAIDDEIIGIDTFEEIAGEKQYDLAIAFGMAKGKEQMDIRQYFEQMAICARYILIDDILPYLSELQKEWKIHDLHVDEDTYYLLEKVKGVYGYEDIRNDA